MVAGEVGGGAAQDSDGTCEGRSTQSNVTRVVAGRVVLLFVCPLVLLVHYDETEAGQGREDCRARAYYDVGVAVANAPPLVELLAGRELAVDERNPAGKACGEAMDSLRRERDFGHEHDC